MIPQEPGMSNQQQIDPMVQQVTEMISASMNQGRDIIDIITELSQQEIDQQVIGQALMMGGMKEEDIFAVFEQVQERMQPPGPSGPDALNQNPQLLARNEELEQPSPENFLQGVETDMMAKSGIEIKKKNRGKFTAWAKARGMGVQEAARKVMANKDKYPPSVVKMANFAKNAAKFKREEGGETFPDLTGDGKVTQADILKGRGVFEPGGEILTTLKSFTDYLDAKKDSYKKNKVTRSGGYNSGGYDRRALMTAPLFNPIGNIVEAGLDVYDNLFSPDGTFTNRDEKRIADQDPSNLAKYYNFGLNVDDSEENVNALANYYRQVVREQREKVNGLDEGDAQHAINNAMSVDQFNDPTIAMQGGDIPKAQFGLRGTGSYNDDISQAARFKVAEEQRKEEREALKAMMSQYPDLPPEEEVRVEDIENPEDIYNEDMVFAEDLLEEVNMPELFVTNPVEGTVNRFLNSQGMKEAAGVAGGIVDIANPVNDYFDYLKKFKAEDDRKFGFMADNAFATQTSDTSDKGNYKELSGMLRSTKDRVVGLDEFLEQPGQRFLSREGGEPNNKGFHALPDFVQDKIMKRQEGGEKGEAAYLANRDRVIKREMAKAQEGTETSGLRTFFNRIKDYEAPLPVELGYDIKQLLGGFDNYQDNPYYDNFMGLDQSTVDTLEDAFVGVGDFSKDDVQDLLKKLNMTKQQANKLIKNTEKYKELDFGEKLIFNVAAKSYGLQRGGGMDYTEGVRQREGSYNPPNRKYTLDPRFKQGGGEIVDLSADMITELIAAGADIEIL